MARGASPHTGPSLDHTTNSTLGFYLYADGSVGEWGDRAMLYSEVIQPATRGHCFQFWYHMSGPHIGTLNLYRNSKEAHASGDSTGVLLWTESGNQGDIWLEGDVFVDYGEPFWFVFVHQRGRETGGDVALDDITIQPGPCDTMISTDPPATDDTLAVGLGVSLTVLVGAILAAVFYVLQKKRSNSEPKIIDNEVLNEDTVIDLHICRIDGPNLGGISEI